MIKKVNNNHKRKNKIFNSLVKGFAMVGLCTFAYCVGNAAYYSVSSGYYRIKSKYHQIKYEKMKEQLIRKKLAGKTGKTEIQKQLYKNMEKWKDRIESEERDGEKDSLKTDKQSKKIKF